jgi:hypothetical protein
MANRSERLKWLLMRIPAGRASQGAIITNLLFFYAVKIMRLLPLNERSRLGGDLCGRPVLGAHKEGNNGIAFLAARARALYNACGCRG